VGWVSYEEDIEKLRAEHEHFQASTDRLIDGLRLQRDVMDLTRAQSQLNILSDRLVSVFEEAKARADQLFKEAKALLSNPDTRITSKLDKLTRQRDEARSARDKFEAERDEARSATERARHEIERLESEVGSLKAERQTLSDRNHFLEAVNRG
jgi:chromosome segregation ATPase